MKKKIFSMTERHISFVKKEAEKYQTSDSETLRRMIDFYKDYYESVKRLQIQASADK